MAAAATAIAGAKYTAEAAAAAGAAAYAYNRGNYMFDSELRFERFTSGREFGCAQTGMYRKDLRKLTELTTKKMSLWCVSASLCMALDIALFCAGRLGLHGASPPGWIEGLWLTNNAASFCFMILTIWLAMHANFRAQAASVHLLTRKVRVPVPTLSQLDKARRLASEFEQQDWSDIFRVPYIMSTGVPADNMPGDVSPRLLPKRARQPSSWVRQEWALDKAGTVMSGPGGELPELLPEKYNLAPEHFRMYSAAQKEWWPYDAYARVSLLYGFLSFIHGLGYYGLGHINIELRAFWVAYATVFVLMVLHALLLRFDIIRGRNKQHELLPNCQWLGPLAVLPAAIAMSLEFRVEYSESAIICSYVLQFMAYGMMFVYQLRMLELVLPDDFQNKLTLEEKVGFQWWPDSWKVPSSFQHVLYLVAPPQKMSPGQYDLVREIKEGSGGLEMVGISEATKGMDSDELKTQEKYLFDLLQWAESEKVQSNLSKQGKSQVMAVRNDFEEMRKKSPRKGKEIEKAKSLRQCISTLNHVMVHEGITPQGLAAAALGPTTDMSPPSTPRSQGSAASESSSKTPPMSMSSLFSPGKSIPNMGMQHVEPWQLVAFVTGAMAVGWAVLIAGTLLEVAVGEQGLVTAPHWSRPPMTRASLNPHETGTPYGFPSAAGARPWLPEQLAWHDEKRGKDVHLIGRGAGYPGIVRRLEASPSHDTAETSAALRSFFGSLPPDVTLAAAKMMQDAPTEADKKALSSVLQSAVAASGKMLATPVAHLRPERLTWPALLQPKLLACDPRAGRDRPVVVAMSPRGFGAAASLGGSDGSIATAFRLTGISHLPPLVGASWIGSEFGEGLLLLSRAGHLLSCAGTPPEENERWVCGPAQAAASTLPFGEGVRLAAGAGAWLRGPAGAGGEPRLHIATLDERSPDVVAIHMLEDTGSWLPIGELRLPDSAMAVPAKKQRVSIAFVNGNELIIADDTGSLIRRSLLNGAVVEATQTPSVSDANIEWQGVCGFNGAHGSTVHLMLRKQQQTWQPEVVSVHPKAQAQFDTGRTEEVPLVLA